MCLKRHLKVLCVAEWHLISVFCLICIGLDIFCNFCFYMLSVQVKYLFLTSCHIFNIVFAFCLEPQESFYCVSVICVISVGKCGYMFQSDLSLLTLQVS